MALYPKDGVVYPALPCSDSETPHCARGLFLSSWAAGRAGLWPLEPVAGRGYPHDPWAARPAVALQHWQRPSAVALLMARSAYPLARWNLTSTMCVEAIVCPQST